MRYHTRAGVVATPATIAEKAPEGSVLLAMLPDIGERYLSSYPFDDGPAAVTAAKV